jgi:predicted PurR-regulated permease PerM
MVAQDPPAQESLGPGRLTWLLLAAGGAVLALAGMRAVNGILGPVLLGLVIVVTVYPVAAWLRRLGLPGWAAMVVTMLVSYGVTLVLVLGTLAALAAFVRILPTYADRFVELQDSAIEWLGSLGVTTADIEQALSAVSAGQIASAAGSALGSVGSVLTALVLMLTVTFFIVLDSAGFPQRFAAVERTRPELAAAMGQWAHGTRLYLLVATVFGAVVALADVAILYWMDIPDPWVWGLLAFLTGYIPNVGFVIGLIPGSVLALLQGGWTDMVIIIVAYSVANFVLQSLVQPKFVGDSVGLATTVTFLSLAFWTFVLGPLGAVLAVPMTLLAKALLVTPDPRLAWADALISSTPKERAEGRVQALDEFGVPLEGEDPR